MTDIDLRDALKRAASALRAHGPEFALAGSYALWAYGGPEPVHDVDFVVAEQGTEAAALTLEKAGLRIDHTPEDWLFKACVDQQFVIDVLHRLNGTPVASDVIALADELDVLAIRKRLRRGVSDADRPVGHLPVDAVWVKIVTPRSMLHMPFRRRGVECCWAPIHFA
jgi:hypothetical protein